MLYHSIPLALPLLPPTSSPLSTQFIPRKQHQEFIFIIICISFSLTTAPQHSPPQRQPNELNNYTYFICWVDGWTRQTSVHKDKRRLCCCGACCRKMIGFDVENGKYEKMNVCYSIIHFNLIGLRAYIKKNSLVLCHLWAILICRARTETATY